jgi:hypothetical protein
MTSNIGVRTGAQVSPAAVVARAAPRGVLLDVASNDRQARAGHTNAGKHGPRALRSAPAGGERGASRRRRRGAS